MSASWILNGARRFSFVRGQSWCKDNLIIGVTFQQLAPNRPPVEDQPGVRVMNRAHESLRALKAFMLNKLIIHGIQ